VVAELIEDESPPPTLATVRDRIFSYWEKRRIAYNLLLLPPAWLGWSVSSDFTYSIDDRYPARLDDPYVIQSAVILLVIANVCYSMVYVLELAFLTGRKSRFWPSARTLLFIVGCLAGMYFAMTNAARLQTNARGGFLPLDQQSEHQSPAENRR
jgi:hypothetical protein